MNSQKSSYFQEIFQQSTKNYQRKDFQKSLKLISTCIELQPENLDLLTNRAMIYTDLGKFEQAIEDLQRLISIDPYNYVPYFNLSSVYFKKGQKQKVYQNLCCSISCLYVAKCQMSQSQEDISKSLFYSSNNVEAYILKSILLLKKGKQKQAILCLQQALEFDQQNKQLRQIYGAVYKHFLPYHPLDDQHFVLKQAENFHIQNLRLKCTYEVDNFDQKIDELIAQRMEEFNSLLESIKILECEKSQIKKTNNFLDQ